MDDQALYERISAAYIPLRVADARCQRRLRGLGWAEIRRCQQAEADAHALVTAAGILLGDDAWHRLYQAGGEAADQDVRLAPLPTE